MGPKKKINLTSGSSNASGSRQGQQSSQPIGHRFVETGRWAAKGTKPLPGPASVLEVFTQLLIHGCKKILFVDIRKRLVFYFVFLIIISLFADYAPFPKTYFANSKNLPNQYFVKFSWGWTFSLIAIFTYMTSSVYCCGERRGILKQLSRLLVGTIVWFIWTNFFVAVEEYTGQCLLKEGGLVYSIKSKKNCGLKQGKWDSFDISGHCFLLIFCVLLIVEEAKVIHGWDEIEDLIRNEEFRREHRSPEETNLTLLSPKDLETLKGNYMRFKNVTRLQVFFLTLLALLWDGMIMVTCTYFHTMTEKLVGGLVAIGSWWFLYNVLYPLNLNHPIVPPLPGSGKIKYSTDSRVVKHESQTQGNAFNHKQLQNPRGDIPMFMGMPLDPLGVRTRSTVLKEPVVQPGV